MKISFLKDSTIRTRILILPILGILGMLFLSGMNWYLNEIKKKDLKLQELSTGISGSIIAQVLNENRFLVTGDEALIKSYEEESNRVDRFLSQLKEKSREEDVGELIQQIAGLKKEHDSIFNALAKNMEQLEKTRNLFTRHIKNLTATLQNMIDAINQEESNLLMEGESLDASKVSLRKELKDFLGFGNTLHINVQELLLFNDGGLFKKKSSTLDKKMAEQQQNVESVLGLVESQELHEKWKASLSTLSKAHKTEDSLFALWQESQELTPKLNASAMEILDRSRTMTALIREDISESTALGNRIGLISTGAGIVVLLALGLLISRGINRSLSYYAENLRDAADQVASASQQVSSSSQTLAEGASEQASAIEETSSSLEEMSAMTKQNAENASQADNLMKETNRVVEEASAAMQELTLSMNEVAEASEQTQRIIKDIDEVAFQTNLLALNAAVEAARAGEAGAGFAVVADEVRNLAMRAAEAAKNTATLIEDTVKKVGQGTELVEKTGEAFSRVAENSSKVGELVAEIAAASNEQAEGIGQVNSAVTQMDKVVQQNAASAEESASASEELSAQAEQMKGMVEGLVAMIGGGKSSALVSSPPRWKGPVHETVTKKAPREASTKTKVDTAKTAEDNAGVDPEKVIPFDDDEEDFEEF